MSIVSNGVFRSLKCAFTSWNSVLSLSAVGVILLLEVTTVDKIGSTTGKFFPGGPVELLLGILTGEISSFDSRSELFFD